MKGALHQYLKQQKALYGNELYLSNEPAPLSEPKHEKKGPLANGKLDAYNQSICTCLECPLGKTRTNFVFGVGDPNADLFLVGEAPGEQEDLKGEPFVGRAGKMLDKILYAIDRKRGDGVYIANVIKC
jgi:DNA polymerase